MKTTKCLYFLFIVSDFYLFPKVINYIMHKLYWAIYGGSYICICISHLLFFHEIIDDWAKNWLRWVVEISLTEPHLHGTISHLNCETHPYLLSHLGGIWKYSYLKCIPRSSFLVYKIPPTAFIIELYYFNIEHCVHCCASDSGEFT